MYQRKAVDGNLPGLQPTQQRLLPRAAAQQNIQRSGTFVSHKAGPGGKQQLGRAGVRHVANGPDRPASNRRCFARGQQFLKDRSRVGVQFTAAAQRFDRVQPQWLVRVCVQGQTLGLGQNIPERLRLAGQPGLTQLGQADAGLAKRLHPKRGQLHPRARVGRIEGVVEFPGECAAMPLDPHQHQLLVKFPARLRRREHRSVMGVRRCQVGRLQKR